MRNVEFEDKDGRVVTLNYKNENDMPNGNHVLAIPVYNSQLLFTHHQQRGIEFPGGKVEISEQSKEAVIRELYEETGAIAKFIYYFAQYRIKTEHDEPFIKDVYFVEVSHLEYVDTYYETLGPCLYHHINDIPLNKRSFLINDKAILHCLERVKTLGFY